MDEQAALIERLRKRYEPTQVPPCRICGRALSIGKIGGGEPTVWACSPYEDDAETLRVKPGRTIADDHYGRSRWEDPRQGGDSDVIALLDLIEPPGWKLVPIEPTQEMLTTPHGDFGWLYADTWKTMLAAAPAYAAIDPTERETVAYFFRFHTDDSLQGRPSFRSWTLFAGKPPDGLEKEGEVRPLVERS